MVSQIQYQLVSTSDNKKAEYKDDEISADVKYPVKHALSRELQVSCIHVDCIDIMSPIPLLLLYDCKCIFLVPRNRIGEFTTSISFCEPILTSKINKYNVLGFVTYTLLIVIFVFSLCISWMMMIISEIIYLGFDCIVFHSLWLSSCRLSVVFVYFYIKILPSAML